MIVIEPFYRADLNWIEVLSQAIGGVVENNYIKGNNSTYEGTHYILPIENNITAMLEDTLYKQDVHFKYTNEQANFVGLYFYSADERDIDFSIDDQEHNKLGILNYNFSIADSSLGLNYNISKGTKAFTICIFIDRELLKSYIRDIPEMAFITEDMFNQDKNTIVRLDRMSPRSSLLIDAFRKVSRENPFYEFHFKGLVYALISDYLTQLNFNKIVIGKAINEDFRSILKSKLFLLDSLEEDFPGVDILAAQLLMSTSKYKILFTKITGVSPGLYFQTNKLQRAKELLATGQYTIGEVSERLKYSSISYLAKRFKETYGVFPKEYQNLL